MLALRMTHQQVAGPSVREALDGNLDDLGAICARDARRSVLRGRVAHEQLDRRGRIEELCPNGGKRFLEHVRTIANRYRDTVVLRPA